MRTKYLVLPQLIMVVFLLGCAVHPEGLAFSTVPNVEDWERTKNQLIQNKEDAIKMGIRTENVEPGVILVGRVGPFRDFSDEAVFDKGYRYYSKIMTARGEEEKILTQEELKSLASGWTTITFAGVPQLGFLMYRAYLPPEKITEIDFSSMAGTFFGGAREDLVAGIYTEAFPFFVITTLLCEDDENYSDCTNLYDWGLYDRYSGRELSSSFKLKEDGNVIDVESFQVLN